jgi:hypothetical protein
MIVSDLEAKGDLGFSYDIRQSGERATVLLVNGGTLLGIWSCSRLGTTKNEIEDMAPDEFDQFCSSVILKIISGDLTCP